MSCRIGRNGSGTEARYFLNLRKKYDTLMSYFFFYYNNRGVCHIPIHAKPKGDDNHDELSEGNV